MAFAYKVNFFASLFPAQAANEQLVREHENAKTVGISAITYIIICYTIHVTHAVEIKKAPGRLTDREPRAQQKGNFAKRAEKSSSNGRMRKSFNDVAMRKGLEPSTSSVTGWHSNQLNYRTIWWALRDLNPGPIGYEPTALTN